MAYNNYNNAPDDLASAAAQADAQMHAQLEQTKNNSINSIQSMVTVTQGADGKAHFMGFEVPKEAAIALNSAMAFLPAYVSKFLHDGVYSHTVSAVEKLNINSKFSSNPRFAHNMGLKASLIATGALIGMQPISEVVHGVKKRSGERKAIKDSLEALEINDKKSYENNEVIKNALDVTNQTFYTGLKQASALIPNVVLNAVWAYGDHKNLVKDRDAEFDLKQAIGSEAATSISAKSDFSKFSDSKRKFEEEFKSEAAKMKQNGFDESEIADFKKEFLAQQRENEKIRLEVAARNNKDAKPVEDNNAAKLLSASAATTLSAILGQWASKDGKDKKVCALKMIMDLQENINSGNVSPRTNLTNVIIDIFQQNEKDSGRSGVGPALLEKFEPLAERIGEVIAKGELDPLALVNLVGDGKVVNKRHFVSEDKLEDILNEQRRILSSHEKTPLDEFLADFQDPKWVMESIKTNLNDLQGKDKAVFASLFSDDVLLASGIKKKEIYELRKDGHDSVYNFIKSSTFEIAQQPVEELKKLGLSEKQITSINKLNQIILSGNDKEVKSVVDRGDSVVGAVRNARLLQEQSLSGTDKCGKKFWTDIINPKEPIVIHSKESAQKEIIKEKQHDNHTSRSLKEKNNSPAVTL